MRIVNKLTCLNYYETPQQTSAKIHTEINKNSQQNNTKLNLTAIENKKPKNLKNEIDRLKIIAVRKDNLQELINIAIYHDDLRTFLIISNYRAS